MTLLDDVPALSSWRNRILEESMFEPVHAFSGFSVDDLDAARVFAR
ncbi:MAG: hypothetical protein ACYCZK_05090 [Microbacteriaceae bacterium]